MANPVHLLPVLVFKTWPNWQNQLCCLKFDAGSFDVVYEKVPKRWALSPVFVWSETTPRFGGEKT